MPTLIHLADKKDAKHILRSGIKIGKYEHGVFFMPQTPDFFVSHQWLRELRCRGARTYVGIHFKLPDKEEVWFGKYGTQHQKAPLGQAIGAFMQLDDKLGYEFLIERKIEPAEILKAVSLPQTVGWRYSPDSHTKTALCVCPMCISRGDIKGRIKREKIEPPVAVPPFAELIERLKAAKDEDEIATLFSYISRKRRKTDPHELLFLLEDNNGTSLQYLASALPVFKHAHTCQMLARLCTHSDPHVREYSAESLLEVSTDKGLAFLLSLPEDAVITTVIESYSK
ncbi:HEAT repeat domain-containing protein [Hymenobacter sp. BT491]|uniref:HEAT repeat domain-containing protein n=1 Tax=Hymenobacter sp. BT491 TaxID=2766779 RepID=UPI001653BC42|nr:HEAT repeat domain-containing protein [Hymenobacter sp. BT491]MBC6989444.1 HEAT repeat domain-containing protein [Hymenobacter sp. BT491]